MRSEEQSKGPTTWRREGDRVSAEAAELDQLFALTLDLLCIIDADGRLVRVSDAWTATLGHPPAELTGRRFMDFVHPDDAAATQAAFAELRAGRPVPNHVNRYRHRDGTFRALEWRAAPFQGRFLYAVGRDITDRVRAEAEHRSHVRFLEHLEQLDEVIRTTADLDELMVRVLDASLAIFGSDRAWLAYPCDPGAPSFTVPMERTRSQYPGAFAQHAVVPMLPAARDAMAAMLASPHPVVYDPRTGRPSPPPLAEQFSIRSQIQMAVHPKLGPPWAFGLHQCSHPRIWSDEDIRLFTEVGRRLADALSSTLLLKDLRAEARRKDEFLAMLGHELRNPLAPIRTATEVLRMVNPGDPRARRAQEILERQTTHLSRIVDDLLDVSRIAHGKVVLRREFRPEAVLCDIGLPGGMDGYAVVAAMRADAALRSALIVAVTGYGQLEDQRRAAAAHFDLHLTKPVESTDLERVLASWAARRAGGPAGHHPA
ncbi:MAG TPA: histidine kinase dimerization/phospho-acceptor domain-containing protein [Polyangia bacterium]|jgi:PAS domain S-box-containing protein